MPSSLRSLLPPQCLGSDSGGRTHNVAGLFRQAADFFLGGIKIDILNLLLHPVFRSHDSVRSGGAHAFRREQSGCDLGRSEEHTSELQSLMRTSYAVFCLKKKKQTSDYNADKRN